MCYSMCEVISVDDVGSRIKAARKAANLTQKRLGEKSGVIETTIRKYELGIQKPKIDNVKKIAAALGISPSDLIGGWEWNALGVEGQGVISMLKAMYDTVDYHWEHTVDNDDVPEYSGALTVTLSKKGQEDIILDVKAWSSLLTLVRQNIPAYIDLILKHQTDAENYEPDYYGHDK